AGIDLAGETAGTFIADNVVSGNALGIRLAGPNTNGTFVQGNLIGVGADSTTTVANSTQGIDVDTQTTNTLVGGTFAGQGNTIANNATGVAIFGNSAEVLGNSFFNNSGLGIDIDNDGSTANDATDSDTGSNNKQNFPTITSAQIAGGNVVIDYNINSGGTAAGSILFEFYKTDGVNEGKTFIGRECRAGNVITFTSSFAAGSVVAGNAITGTATSYSDGTCATVLDGTSEFASTPTVVTNCAPPSAGIVSPTSVCSGSTGNSAGTTALAGATYAWSILNGTITSATNGPSITFTAGASGTVDLQLIKTNSLGCSNTGNASVPITAPPTVTITGPTASCPAAPITLDAGGGFASYSWNTGATSQTIVVSPTVATTYSVTVTDANGCTGADSHAVTMNPVPTPVITGPTSTCSGTPVTLDAGGGFATYSWSTGATSQTISVAPTTTTPYSVTVTNGSGCSGSDSHTVTVSANPTATISTPSSICANGSANASVPAQGGATYAWTVTNGTLNSGQGTASINFTAGASGSVNIGVLITAGSCSSNGSTSVPITGPPAPVITGPTAVCPNTTFILDAGPGFASYAWNTGATSQQIAVSQSVPTGTYSVIVTAAGGCTGSDSHVVTLLADPISVINAPGNVDAGSTGNNANVPLQGGATYSWTATNGTITAGAGTNAITFSAGTSGDVVLGVTVTIGSCSSSGSVAIPIGSTLADLALTKTATPAISAGGTITYTLSVTNNGPDAATNVIVTDNFPDGVTPTTASGANWSCVVGATAIVCQMPVLGAGNAAPIVIAATGPSQGGTITNTASVGSSIGDPNPANNSGSATTVVNAPQTPQCAARLGPQLLAPSQLASVNSPVTFSWTSISDAIDYDVFYIAGNAPPALAGTTAATSLTANLPSGPITWWVVARPPVCGPLFSDRGQFTVLAATNCATHGAPQTVSPSLNATVGTSVAFSWTPVPAAIGYRLFIAVNNEAPQDIATTDGATFFTATVQPGRITWFVDALFGGCPPTRSASSTFTVVAPDPCANRGTATLIAPANNSTQPSASIDFAWNAVANASEYRVWAQVDTGTPAVLGATNDTKLQATIARGVIRWWVESIFPGCLSTESQHFLFTVPDASRCDNVRPTILSPQNNATTTNANVTFAWTSVPGAVAYEVWLALNGGSPTLLNSTNATVLTAEVPAGVLDVFVRAIVSGCPTRDSNVTRFRFDPPAPCATNTRPILYSPLENNEVISPAAFVFTPGFGAIKHELYIAHGSGAFTLAGSTAGNGTIINNVALRNGAGRWLVRAYFANNCPPLDSTESS
ncbi:MAG TPA: hypothetical protein VN181_11080, partial [Thermoanaerobaculia bacterium]|nr:hypothetical protein [Thermoanaerobaculia bacterium]